MSESVVYLKRMNEPDDRGRPSWWILMGSKGKSGHILTLSVIHCDELSDLFGKDVEKAVTTQWRAFKFTVEAGDE